MPTFLLKTEPDDYSFADLQRDKRTVWSGVSNPAARAALRAMKKGDQAFIYHTGDVKAIVGLARAATSAYEDPKRPGLNERGEINYPVVDLAPVRAAKTPLPLAIIKADKRFAKFELVTISRLSVMRVPEALDGVIRACAGL